MNTLHFSYWTLSDKKRLDGINTFGGLANLAIEIICRMPERVEMVSGPISTGGVGNTIDNRRVFERMIEILIEEHKLNIFSQMPFEDKIVELYQAWRVEFPTEKYCTPILCDFYEKIFSSGKISFLNFIHGWESSFGAKWEHDNCDRWNIGKKFLKKHPEKAFML